MITVAVLNTVALVFAAFRWRLPVLHTGAIACAALAYLTTFYLLTGKLTFSDTDPYGARMLQLMISAQSGTALAGLFLVLAAVSELLVRVGRRRHGVIYLGGCGGVAVVGLLLVTVHGLRTGGGDALRAAILYAVYGAGCLTLMARWCRLGLGYLGLVLVTSSALWALGWQSAAHHIGPCWGAVLAIEALIMAAAAAVLQHYATGAWYDPWKMFDEDRLANSMPRSKGLSLLDLYRIPLVHVGEAAAMLAAALTAWTTWCDRVLIVDSPTPAPIVASAAIAAIYFLLAWIYRSPSRTWVASSITLAGMVHALNFNYFQSANHIGPTWTLAFLGHATLALLALFCLDRLRSVGKVITGPLANSALFSSLLALPAIIFARSGGSLWLACCFPWLAAIWLVLASRKRSVVLFAAHQAALAFAALAATTVWLKHVGWVIPLSDLPLAPNLLERIASVSHALLDPRNLQAYGIALGLLSLVWVVARIIDLRQKLPSPVLGRGAVGEGFPDSLLQSRFSLDGCIRQGVVVMQWLVVAFCILGEVPSELFPGAVSVAIPNAFGPTAWILLGVLAVMLIATLWERWRTAELVAVLLLAATLPCLIAGQFAPDLAVASAARWSLAIGFAVCSTAIWERKHLADMCQRIHAGPFVPGIPTSLITAPRVARSVLLMTMVLPMLAFTVMGTMLQINNVVPGGPVSNSFFETLGPMRSYLVPLLLVIVALVGYALRERSSGYAFSAGLVLDMAVVLGYGLRATLAKQPFDATFFATLIQLFGITAAVWAIVWLIARKRLYELREMTLSPLLATQVLLPVIGNCALAVLPVAWLIHTPGWLPPWMNELAAPQGWIGLLLTAAIAAWYLRQSQAGSLLHVLGGLALGAGVLVACYVASIYPPASTDAWIAYHTLTTAWAAAGLIVFALAFGGRTLGGRRLLGPRSLIQPWVATLGTLTVAMATLHAFHDPARPWWAAGAILTVSLTSGLVALLLRKPVHVYFSGMLINLAGTIVWWAYSPSGARWPDWNLAEMPSLVQANVLCLAIGSVVWSLLELLPLGVPNQKADGQQPFAHLAAQVGAVLLGLVVVAGVATTLFSSPLPYAGEGQGVRAMHIPIGQLDWIALAGIVTATAVCLRDRRAHFTLPTLYRLGLSAIGLGLLARQLTPRMFCWSAVDELAGYTLVAATIAWFLPRSQEGWFSRIQAVVIAVAGTLALWVALDFNFDRCHYEGLRGCLAGRMAAVPGLSLLLLAAIVMAGVASRTWRTRWQYGTLKMGVLLLSGLGWAMLAADGPAPWLHRSVIVMVAAAAVGLLAGFGLKWILPVGSDWIQRGRQAVPVLAGLAISMLAAVLVQEASLFALRGGAPMVPVAIAVVIVALAGLIAGCIAFAVMPTLDPLRLSDRGRQGYIYAAEALAAAVGLHVWLTMPWLFKGYLIDYWMLIVMAIAFVGAGLSEWFHRRNLAVLSQPLAHTAILLPLLPTVGFWIAPMLEPEGPWHLVGRAPAVWFLMALFYGVMAVTQRSWKCMVLAVLSANLGLWVGLNLSDFHFLQNPQLFVIPVALAGLVAEYLNHNRLSEAQSTAFRYLTLSAIYISSTADMFIAGLGNSWGLPLVLMVLSVAGMLAGILFRVRSFLFLGLTFLVLDVMSMIWHAAHNLNHTWIWYVCGIVLGAAILAMFALFEKRRNDVLAAVEQLKDWAK